MFSSIIKFPLIEIKKVGEEGNKIKRNEEKSVALKGNAVLLRLKKNEKNKQLVQCVQ